MPYLLAGNSDNNNAGSIAGGLLTALFVVSVIIIAVVTFLYLFMKQRKKQKRMERLQRDILSRCAVSTFMYTHDIFLLRVGNDSSESEMATTTFMSTEKQLNTYSQLHIFFLY